jgi:hypothetical protein
MARNGFMGLLIVAALALGGAQSAPVIAQTTDSAPLASVRLARKVTANGQPLAAGTYSVRLSNDAVTPVVGQAADGSRWVEFVQGDQVKGRELATVLTAADAKTVVKSGKPPAAGSARVELLKGSSYVRVWINRGGTQYLIHLATVRPATSAR